jgi:pyruvate,water dikinase
MGDRNYVIVSPEYLNLNARLAYHFSMVDALVCQRSVSNYISFRFRGGGAARARRGLRARFLAAVLLYEGFSVDQREDLVTAWFKGYDMSTCESKLEILGRLMGCARQLDMLLGHDSDVKHFVEQFLNANYEVFH